MQTNILYPAGSTGYLNTMINPSIMTAKKTFLLALALLPTASSLYAQTTAGSNSPYSRYGFGLLSDRAVGFNKGMGGVAYGMRNGRELNPANPASYSSIDSLTFLFDIGMTFQNGNIDDGRARTNARNTSLDYVTAGFRLSPNLGMSLGLLPYSTIGYQMETSGYLGDGSATTTETYMGDGGAYAIGSQHLVNAATRNEKMLVLVANNTNYAMTGGQMLIVHGQNCRPHARFIIS